MKTVAHVIDIIVAILLIIGGLNWGLIGVANFDLVGSIVGYMDWPARIIYICVGFAAIWQIVQFKAIIKRWKQIK